MRDGWVVYVLSKDMVIFPGSSLMCTIDSHPTEETIELYSLGRLAEDLVPPLEEHLLVCERCQGVLREDDIFAHSIKALSKCKPRPRGNVGA